MKLWKSKKATSCVSAVSGKLNISGNKSSGSACITQNGNNDDQIETISAASTATPTNQSTIQLANGIHQAPRLDGRALSPAQSEDSGLAADRGTTYATISIPRQNAKSMGIIFAERSDVSYPPMIETINLLEPSADFLAPGDRIHQIDGISTIGLTNEQVMNCLLCNRDENTVIEIEYSLPEYFSQNSLCVTTKLAQVTVERENGCLGLTLRGGSEMPIIVTNVRAFGPAFKTSRIKPGDRVLRVDNISLVHKSLAEAQQILKCGHTTPFCNLTIEYEVSVMQTTVEFSLGPLLIEIERSMNEQLGLMLSSFMPLSQDFTRIDGIQPTGIFIASILPASISERCGALSVGDQILSVDETVVENSSFTPDDVQSLLDAECTKGFTQLQILPANAIIRRKGLQCTSPKYMGFNTMDPRRTPKLSHHKKLFRKSSLPLDGNSLMGSITRTERIQVVLDCTHGSGLGLSMTPQSGSGFVVTKIQNDSVADRSGCIQKGDRIVSVNKLYNLEIQLIRQILRDTNINFQQPSNTQQTAHWVELEIEFEMLVDDASRGIFNIKLMKTSRNAAGVGVTVSGSSHGSFVVTDIKPGSPAHRASIKIGDILLAIDSHPIQHFNVDVLLKENKNDCITLTIKRNMVQDFLFENQNRMNSNAVTYANFDVTTNTFGGYGNNNNTQRSNDSPTKYQNGYNEEPHYSSVPAPRYWNTLKLNKSDFTQHQQEDIMGNAISATDLVNYNNVDFTAAQQKIMSLSIGPSQNHTHATQTEFSSQPITSFQTPQPMSSNLMTSSFMSQNQTNVFNVQLHHNGGPLGITLSGNEDGLKPIIISGLQDGGIAYNTGQIQIGDQLLAINKETVIGLPLSNATKLLQVPSEAIELRLSRNINNNNTMTSSILTCEKVPLPQALYAEIQRRPNLTKADVISNASSRSGSNNSDGQLKTIHVTLYKDQVYDDYGFSVSDGLYERGVYINRIRSGGPADQVQVLKPYDRIIQVNGTKTMDFDCCLTVPLIAASGDKINLIVQRGVLE